MDYPWNDEDLQDLDAKFDALAEYLGLEFVFERVSDGSDVADSSRCYARKKAVDPVITEPAPTKQETIASSVSQEKTPMPEQKHEAMFEEVEHVAAEATPECSSCSDLGRKCIRHRPKKKSKYD